MCVCVCGIRIVNMFPGERERNDEGSSSLSLSHTHGCSIGELIERVGGVDCSVPVQLWSKPDHTSSCSLYHLVFFATLSLSLSFIVAESREIV